MKFKVNEVYEGFKLIEDVYIEEIKANGKVFEHEKTGARLLNISNDDDNKVFAIGFRTPPNDSTGLPHILEHSVLCGSRKFDVKEPFVELLKSSLNTFLNAMTYPDKTIYPVASRNEKDFKNLIDVYLDAVLYPNIYKYPEIFMQEGWSYSLENKDSELKYNGVVYNEMKGAYSSPDSLVFRKITETLYPDTIYSHSSGGDPEVIPELTYEDFIAFHKKYYHPSNSFIYLYGDGDLIEQLKFINDEYLSNFERQEIDSEIGTQEPFEEMKEYTYTYSLSEDDSTENKSFLNLNFSIGSALDINENLALTVIEYLLLETPAAPLKKALLEAGIGKSVFGEFENGIKQPYFSIVAKDANENDKDKFKKVVFDTLESLVKGGIEKELIEAAINKIEFILREGDYRGYPTGIVYYTKAMDSWLYGGDPFVNLAYESVLENAKRALHTKYFEDLIEKHILNNPHSSFAVLKPEKGLLQRKERELDEKLSKYKNELSDKEIESIIEKGKKLKERQLTKDTKEALNSIPSLEIEDINKEADKLPLEIKEENGVKVLFHEVETNKIGYLKLLFNVKVLPKELLPYAKLLSDVIGKIGTKNYSYGSLANAIGIHSGAIFFNVTSYVKSGNPKDFSAVFMVKAKALMDKLDKTTELIGEILENTLFDDKERVLQNLREIKSYYEMSMFSSGHIVAAKRMMSYFSPKGSFDEIIDGIGYYKFLCDIEKNFESKWDEVKKNLEKTREELFNKSNLTVSFTSDKEDYDSVKNPIESITKILGDKKVAEVTYDFNLEDSCNEGLLTQGNVQYVAKGGNFINNGYKYNGSALVLETIANFDYLWNNVRVQGGAYGVVPRISRSGNMFITSYRDPNIKETLKVYDEMPGYLKELEVDEETMTKYIIGTISKLDSPLTPSMKSEYAIEQYYMGISHETKQRERNEVIETKLNNIKDFAPVIESVMKQNHVCVLGNEKKIKDNSDVFGKLINVIE